MAAKFYIYGSFKAGKETITSTEFSFSVDAYEQIKAPAFLLWLFADTDGEAMVCKIRRTAKPTDIGMAVYVFDARRIRISGSGIVNSVSPYKSNELTGKEIAEQIIAMRALLPIPDEKVDLVRKAILKSNQHTIADSYFDFNSTSPSSQILVEASDAFHTGFRIFGFKIPNSLSFREQQLLDFDIATFLPNSSQKAVLPDGRHFFEHAGKRLYIHKVDRTKIEECLGVDLIYNYLDEKRIVLVQYKCHTSGKPRYYPSSDSNHDREVERMDRIPGLSDCYNLISPGLDQARLCRCPVFIKLCRREISETHSVPVGVYFPLCVWKSVISKAKGVSVQTKPHLNSLQFQELVRSGLIGSGLAQSRDIESHLITKANDSRLKLVFEEESIKR